MNLHQIQAIAADESLSWAERAKPIRELTDYMGYPLDFEDMSDEDVVRWYLS